MSIDLEYDGVGREVADSVRRFVRDHDRAITEAGGSPDAPLWRALADLGVLGLAREEEAPLLIAATMEALGASGFPGPLVATFTATRLLSGETAEDLTSGQGLVSLGVPPLMPWAPVATVHVELDADGTRAWLARVRGSVEAVETLAGEPWGRCTLDRVTDLGDAGPALALGEVALCAYLVGAAERLLDVATSHAGDRMQFGRPIGDFQAVSHPLADCAMRLAAARALTRIAAYELAQGAPQAAARIATARLSATGAALATAYRAHQTLGALAFTVEGPVGRLAARVRQCTLLPPGVVAARRRVLTGLDL
ncbi:MAG TPA: acyl-CoA dehydrogenase family protein [Candidatus Dormibacteraeota bacterium]